MKKVFVSILLILCGGITAHEFWLEPQKFFLKKSETVMLNFKVGENFAGQNWKGNAASVKSLKLYYADIEDDLESLLTEETEGDSLSLQFFDEGTALVAYQSNNKHIELEPAKFLEYLQEDGLTDAIAYREAHGEKDSVGREHYMRCAKTLFQVGAHKDEVHKKYCSMPLEFIPEQHPYLLRHEQPLSFRLLLRGKPLAGTQVKFWRRLNNKSSEIDCTTNQDGIIEIPVSSAGKFMVSAVYMERIENEPDAQWQSYWATFTWGY